MIDRAFSLLGQLLSRRESAEAAYQRWVDWSEAPAPIPPLSLPRQA